MEKNIKKHEIMRNLNYLKNIALDIFEIGKAELKGDARFGIGFHL